MNIATVAAEPIWKDAKANVEQAREHVRKILELYPKVDVILFPETYLMAYVLDASNQDVAELIDGYCVTEIKRIAKKYGVAIVCGMIEKNPDGKPFNTEIAVSKKGELLAKYSKIHLYSESPEPNVFTAGEELATFELEGWKCGLSICFDIRYPRLFEAYKNAGVECIFAGFNWPKGRNKPAILENSVKTRAHENQFFFAAAVQSGSDPNYTYCGASVIASPYAEDVSQKNGIYSYAEISKDDIATLSKALPLSASFKENYRLN